MGSAPVFKGQPLFTLRVSAFFALDTMENSKQFSQDLKKKNCGTPQVRLLRSNFQAAEDPTSVCAKNIVHRYKSLGTTQTLNRSGGKRK